MKTYQINGLIVHAEFEFQDLRCARSKNTSDKELGEVQIITSISVDGECHDIVLQNNGDGELEVADSDAQNEDEQEALFDALGGVMKDDGGFLGVNKNLEPLISIIIEEAQFKFNTALQSGLRVTAANKAKAAKVSKAGEILGSAIAAS